MTPLFEPVVAEHDPLLPDPYRLVGKRLETDDIVTLFLEPVDGARQELRAGQFNMLTAFGVGEVAISVSGAPGAAGPLEHTVRAVGAVSSALCHSEIGALVGVRGPFGTDWGVEELTDDVVVVAGGIGLAPLRGAVEHLVEALEAAGDRRSWEARRRHVTVLIGARMPSQIVFAEDLGRWRKAGARVDVTVDMADQTWPGPVGVVTTLLASQELDPARTSALVCGPEVMMRFTVRGLLEKGISPERIRVSLERNMQCGIGLCGHCQLGPLLLCRDGPVVSYDGVVPHLMSERER